MEEIAQILESQGYRLEPAGFATGRPDRAALALVTPSGERAVGKVYPPGAGESTYRNMQALWHSSFGERRTPPGLPRPIEYLPGVRVLVMQRLEGRPWAELGRAGEEAVEGAMHLLACLHGCDAQPPRQRDARRILRSVQRKAGMIAELAPHFSGPIWAVVRTLEEAVVDSGDLVPSHGDFSARNILIGPGGRLSLIDWDRFQRTDSARDVAYVGVWAWVAALREGHLPDWAVLERAVRAYRSLRPQAAVETRLDFYIAAGLVRVAHSLVRLWPEDAHLVPRLAAEALQRLA